MSKIKTVKHVENEEQDGELVRVSRIEYEFGDNVSSEAKRKVRNHVPKLRDKSEIRRVIESVDTE